MKGQEEEGHHGNKIRDRLSGIKMTNAPLPVFFILANPDQFENSLYPEDSVQRVWIDVSKGLL